MADEDFGDVTQHGEHYGSPTHRTLKVKRCENGYIVEYNTIKEGLTEDDPYRNNIIQKTRVFITNSDMLEFAENYFKGEPKP